jgi:hypothetical protein
VRPVTQPMESTKLSPLEVAAPPQDGKVPAFEVCIDSTAAPGDFIGALARLLIGVVRRQQEQPEPLPKGVTTIAEPVDEGSVQTKKCVIEKERRR